MIWPDEVREAEFGFLDDGVEVRPQELAMANSLIESMAGDFDPTQYHDDYREALERVIEAKVEGREVVEPADQETPKQTGVVDLMAALRASVERAKQSRGDAGDEVSARRGPAKKPAAKQAAKKAATPAKKAAAKKATAKKVPAKKVPATKPAKTTLKKAASRRSA